MEKFRSFFAFLANSLIFLLMGLIVQQISIQRQDARLPVVLAIVLVTVMRFVSIYLPVNILNIFLPARRKTPPKRQFLLSRGDLRGVVGLTLALMIPNDFTMAGRNLPYTPKDFILLLSISVIIFSLIVKGLTMHGVIKKL